MDLGAVDLEEVEQEIIVLERSEVGKHGAAGIGHVGNVDLVANAAIEIPDEPGIDGAKGKTALVVGILDDGIVTQQPGELDRGRIGRQRQATPGLQRLRAGFQAQLPDKGSRTRVGPSN